MTNLQLQLRFEQRFHTHITKDLDIRTIDIEFYLNEGYRRFIEFWYNKYEADESARKRLSPLVALSILTSTGAGNYINSLYFTLPTDCRYIVQETVDISFTNCHGDPSTLTNVKVKPIKLDYYNAHINNPFKKPYIDLVWRMDVGSRRHELIYGTDTTTINQYKITYIKNPLTITLLSGTPETTSCEISAEYHEEIVDRAIESALDTFKLSNSFKTN